MSVLAIGLNHHSAPLALRSRLAVAAPQLPQALQALRQRLAPAGRARAPEATLLSTCNRTEIYVADDTGRACEAAAPALAWLADSSGTPLPELAAHTYTAHDTEAARHAFRVAAGLDSMVLGEPQILGQIKTAVREAGQAGLLGSTLNQLFQRSFSVAKEVRTATEIGTHSVSMAAATLRLASQLFEDVRALEVLFVGAGEMIELVATHFAGHAPRGMTVANRSAERARDLAMRLKAGGVAHGAAQAVHTLALAELPAQLHRFDVVVSCTASTLPLIGLGAVERALKARRRRPMLMVDLAVPRDIEPEVARLSDVYLYTLDDLGALVQTAGAKRQAAVAQAEAIVDAGVKSFGVWLEQRASVPLICALNRQAQAWQAAELARARKLLARGGDVDAALASLAHGLAAKLMHGAMAELHRGDGAAAHTVSRLFLRGERRAVESDIGAEAEAEVGSP